MRKCASPRSSKYICDHLQCGRIYKDAEIRLEQMDHNGQSILQCGRIYKDAEIGPHSASRFSSKADLQCGRIYKDAEIEHHEQNA